MNWDWKFAWEIMPTLLEAFQITVLATVIGMALALVLGLILAVLRRSHRKFIRYPVGFLVEFVRSTPLLVQIFFFFYVMPDFGVRLDPFLTGVLALGVHYSSYTSEVYRAGIDAVPRGQWEAATALNLSPSRTWFGVVLPQAIPPVIPALGNYLVAMFKDTPMLSTITVLELLYAAKDIGSETFRYLEPLTLVGGLFLAVSLLASTLIGYLERTFRVRQA